MGEARLNRKGSPPSFPALVQQFFTEYLVAQRALSPRTVACYRDAMTLFLGYAAKQLGKPPITMQLVDCPASITLAGRRQLSWPVEARHEGSAFRL